jgi:hypothetical protein
MNMLERMLYRITGQAAAERREIRREQLHEELKRLDRREDGIVGWTPVGFRTGPAFDIKDVLEIRDRKAAVMDELGWKDMAADLRADTAWRRDLA